MNSAASPAARLCVSEAVVCEGKYDQIKLSSLLDALIIPTDGFGIFKDHEKLSLLRELAKTWGLIFITDSDAAGFQIRSYLRGAISEGRIVNIYIPDLYGKEKRKRSPGREGKLGVEGMPAALLREAFEKAGVTVSGEPSVPGEPVTAADLYRDGFSGRADSVRRRRLLQQKMNLPERMSQKLLIQVINSLYGRDEYRKIAADLIPAESIAERNENK